MVVGLWSVDVWCGGVRCSLLLGVGRLLLTNCGACCVGGCVRDCCLVFGVWCLVVGLFVVGRGWLVFCV